MGVFLRMWFAVLALCMNVGGWASVVSMCVCECHVTFFFFKKVQANVRKDLDFKLCVKMCLSALTPVFCR